LEKNVFIFLTAYSPRWNIIASRRIEGLAHYISEFFETYIIAGIPKSLDQSEVYFDYDIGSANLIEVPSLFSKKKSSTRHSVQRLEKKPSLNLDKLKKYVKLESLPFLEMFLPVSPGGMVYHNQKKFLEELEKIVIREYGKKKIYIFASYGPSFILKIAKKIKKKYPLVEFVADFRDWAYRYYEGFFYNSVLYKFYTKSLLKTANKITFVSKVMLEYYKEKLNLSQSLLLLPNGFDPLKIQSLGKSTEHDVKTINKVNIIYTGSIHYKMINPERFIHCLGQYIKSSSTQITFTYAGRDLKIIEETVTKYNIKENFVYIGLLSHKASLMLQQEADLLLLLAYTGKDQLIGSSIITGKFFEYLASGRPILVIGPESWEMREIVESDMVSKVIQDNDCEAIKRFLDGFHEAMKQFNLTKRSEFLEIFSYKRLAEKLRKFVSEGYDEGTF